MQKILSKLIKIIILMGTVTAIAGCGNAPAAPAPAVNPTQDVSSIKTEAVETVVAQITADAVLHPAASATSAPATETKVPEPSLTLSMVASLTPSVTSFVTFTPIASTTATPLPTIPISDQAQLLYRTPKEWSQFKPGEPFDVVWTLKNIGKKTWSTEYFFTYFNGTQMHYNDDLIFISSPVKSGDNVQFTVDMKAPDSPGNYTTSWAFYNDNKAILGQYFITIIVVDK
jgi:hypothetical protein